MMYTLVLLGIYYLSVAVIYGVTRVRPGALWLMYLIVAVGLFSFVPAIAFGREMLLRTGLWNLLSAVPIWLSISLSVLFVVAAFPVRKWIQEKALERTAEASRRFLNRLPARVMSIEAAESRHEINLEKAIERKAQIQRDADRISAIDGTGRLLYWLLKLHMVRLGLQIAGVVTVATWIESRTDSTSVVRAFGSIMIDGLTVWLPLLLIVVCLPRMLTRTMGTDSEG